MSKILPQRIECLVRHDGRPVGGLMLGATLKTETRNAYHVVFGPTGIDGRAILDSRTIKEWADSEVSVALMDFDPLEGTFAGVVEVCVMTEDKIDAALKAHELFSPETAYPADYVDNLLRSRKVLAEIGGSSGLEVSGAVEPDSIRLTIS